MNKSGSSLFCVDGSESRSQIIIITKLPADEEDLVALQFRVAIGGIGHHLYQGDQDAEGLRDEGDGRAQFDTVYE
jgi:hypothetical protein